MIFPSSSERFSRRVHGQSIWFGQLGLPQAGTHAMCPLDHNERMGASKHSCRTLQGALYSTNSEQLETLLSMGQSGFGQGKRERVFDSRSGRISEWVENDPKKRALSSSEAGSCHRIHSPRSRPVMISPRGVDSMKPTSPAEQCGRREGTAQVVAK